MRRLQPLDGRIALSAISDVTQPAQPELGNLFFLHFLPFLQHFFWLIRILSNSSFDTILVLKGFVMIKEKSYLVIKAKVRIVKEVIACDVSYISLQF